MRAQHIKIARIVAVLGMIALVPLLAACTQDAASSATNPPASQAEQPTATSSDATVKLTAPVDGATVPAGTLTATVDVTGLELTMPSNTNVDGQGHVHFTLDDRPFEMSVEPQIELKDVGPGAHTLKAELVQNNTDSFDPPIEQIIEFTAE